MRQLFYLGPGHVEWREVDGVTAHSSQYGRTGVGRPASLPESVTMRPAARFVGGHIIRTRRLRKLVTNRSSFE